MVFFKLPPMIKESRKLKKVMNRSQSFEEMIKTVNRLGLYTDNSVSGQLNLIAYKIDLLDKDREI
jgi:hypothetical protein